MDKITINSDGVIYVGADKVGRLNESPQAEEFAQFIMSQDGKEFAGLEDFKERLNEKALLTGGMLTFDEVIEIFEESQNA